jgi:hypothetical protein
MATPTREGVVAACPSTRKAGTTHFETEQEKFAASSMVPVPLYTATFGNGHRGRALVAFPSFSLEAMMRSGTFPCSTHSSITLMEQEP